MIPMVHKIEILRRNPSTSATRPRMIIVPLPVVDHCVLQECPHGGWFNRIHRQLRNSLLNQACARRCRRCPAPRLRRPAGVGPAAAVPRGHSGPACGGAGAAQPDLGAAELTNYFLPQQKLLAKIRDGAKITKIYDRPTTPQRRAELHPAVTAEDKTLMTDTLAGLNPAAVQRAIQALTAQLLTLTTGKARATTRPQLPAPSSRALGRESTTPATRAS